MAKDILSREPTQEAEQIKRIMRDWLQTYSGKPLNKVEIDFLGETSGLCLETIQAAYKAKTYIYGGYLAQFQFAILYKLIPTSANARLRADEVLNNYAAWAVNNAANDLPARLPSKCRFKRLTQNTVAALAFQPFENGSEVHQIIFTLLYEVNV